MSRYSEKVETREEVARAVRVPVSDLRDGDRLFCRRSGASGWYAISGISRTRGGVVRVNLPKFGSKDLPAGGIVRCLRWEPT